MTTFTGPFSIVEKVSAQDNPGDRFQIGAAGTARSGTSASDFGEVLLTQRSNLAITSAGGRLAIPAGSDLIGFTMFVDTGAGSAATATVRIGTSADSTQIGTFTYTGGTDAPQGTTDMTVSGSNNWADISTTPLVIDVTAVGSADTAFQGHVHATYRR